jgi:hypothetical protein
VIASTRGGKPVNHQALGVAESQHFQRIALIEGNVKFPPHGNEPIDVADEHFPFLGLQFQVQQRCVQASPAMGARSASLAEPIRPPLEVLVAVWTGRVNPIEKVHDNISTRFCTKVKSCRPGSRRRGFGV